MLAIVKRWTRYIKIVHSSKCRVNQQATRGQPSLTPMLKLRRCCRVNHSRDALVGIGIGCKQSLADAETV